EIRRVRDGVDDLVEHLVERQVRIDAGPDLEHLLEPCGPLPAGEELRAIEPPHLVGGVGQLLVSRGGGFVRGLERPDLAPEGAPTAGRLPEEESGGAEGPGEFNGRSHGSILSPVFRSAWPGRIAATTAAARWAAPRTRPPTSDRRGAGRIPRRLGDRTGFP